MFVHSIEPVLLRIAGFEIRYYGLVYASSFLFLLVYMRRVADSGRIKNLTKELATDMVTWCVIAMIIGARLFHIFVYNLHYYLANPGQMLRIWEGGLAFHGGFLGIILMGWFFCRRYKINFYQLADVVVIPLTLFIGLGRVANFINSELYGNLTELPWAVKFPDAAGWRHPSQLYEALMKFCMFGILYYMARIKNKPGFIFWNFVLMYGITRFIAEIFRYNEVRYLGLSIPQYFSIVMVVLAVYILKRR